MNIKNCEINYKFSVVLKVMGSKTKMFMFDDFRLYQLL